MSQGYPSLEPTVLAHNPPHAQSGDLSSSTTSDMRDASSAFGQSDLASKLNNPFDPTVLSNRPHGGGGLSASDHAELSTLKEEPATAGTKRDIAEINQFVDSVGGRAPHNDSYVGGTDVRANAYATADSARDTAHSAANSARSTANSAAQSAQYTANSAADATRNAANSAAQSAQSTANNAADATRNVANSAAQSAQYTANSAADATRNAANSAAQSAQSTANYVSNTASNAADSARSTANSAAESAKSTVNSAADSARNAAQNIADSVPTATGIRQRVNKLGEQLEHTGEDVANHPAVKNAKVTAEQQVGKLRQFLGGFPIVREMEKRTGIDRVALVASGIIGYILLVNFNVLGLALPITQSLTVIPAVFQAIQVLDQPVKAQDEEVKSLLSYFVILSLIQLLESFAYNVLARRIPQYWTVKLIFLAWLLHPQTQGAQKVYKAFLSRFSPSRSASLRGSSARSGYGQTTTPPQTNPFTNSAASSPLLQTTTTQTTRVLQQDPRL